VVELERDAVVRRMVCQFTFPAKLISLFDVWNAARRR
jgi:hypothetical protein